MDIDDLTLYCEGDLTDYNFLNTNEGVSIEQKVIKAGYSFNKLILSADCQSMPEKSRDAVAANLCAAPLTKIVTQCPNSGGGIFNACGYWVSLSVPYTSILERYGWLMSLTVVANL